MKTWLFLERNELAEAIAKHLNLKMVQMVHSEEILKSVMRSAEHLIVIHKKYLSQKEVEKMNEFYMTKEGARLFVFYDVLGAEGVSLFPALPCSVLYEKRRAPRHFFQTQALWTSSAGSQPIFIQNLSRLGAEILSPNPMNDTLGKMSFEAEIPSAGKGLIKKKLNYWGKLRWSRSYSSNSQQKSNFQPAARLYGVYFVSQETAT